jgi:hypothetical protein
MKSIYEGRPDLVADARSLDRALRPIAERVLARLGWTKEQAITAARAQRPAPEATAAQERGEA